MISKPKYLLAIMTAFIFSACDKGAPAGFWKNYKKDQLQSHINDQGPYGGHRAIYWKSPPGNVFTSKDMLAFANEHGWTFVDSLEFTREQTLEWMHMQKPVFPLSHTGFGEGGENVSTYEKFPRWFEGGIKVFSFKTGWVAIAPGTDDANEINGYILISADRKQMALYHLWGE